MVKSSDHVRNRPIELGYYNTIHAHGDCWRAPFGTLDA